MVDTLWRGNAGLNCSLAWWWSWVPMSRR